MAYEQYTLVDWLLCFYIYCFIGWCFESAYVSIQTKKLVNRGFMRGPFLPLYGSGAVMMLVVTIPFRENLLLTYLAGAVGASILEYCTGAIMEALFKVRYWDYSNHPFNIHGHVCLGATLLWGLFTVLMVNVLHAPIENLLWFIKPSVKGWIVLFLTVAITADFALSFKAALDLRDILAKMTAAKEELARAQKRLDAIIAFSGQKLSQQAEGISSRYQITENLRLIKSKLDFLQKPQFIQFKDEIEQIKTKYILAIENRKVLSERLDFFRKGILNAHPSITSPKFKDALEELKEIASEKRNPKD